MTTNQNDNTPEENKDVLSAEDLVSAYEGYVDPSFNGIQAILLENAEDMYRAHSSIYISDVIMEEAVLEGVSEPEPLLEAFNKNTWDRVKQGLADFMEKVKAWFVRVINIIKTYTANGLKFVKDHADEIKKKNTEGFTFNGYVYDTDGGNQTFNGIRSKISDHIDKLGVLFDKFSVSANPHQEPQIQDSETIMKSLDARSVVELTKRVKVAYQGGEHPSENVRLSPKVRDHMIETLSNRFSILSFVEDKQKIAISQMKTVYLMAAAFSVQIASDDKYDNKQKADLSVKMFKRMHAARQLLAINVQITTAAVDVIRQMGVDYYRIMKQFVKWKPDNLKEPVDAAKENATNVLESVFDVI